MLIHEPLASIRMPISKIEMFFSTLQSSYEIYIRKTITYIAFNFNDDSYTVNAQTIDSATCNFFLNL